MTGLLENPLIYCSSGLHFSLRMYFLIILAKIIFCYPLVDSLFPLISLMLLKIYQNCEEKVLFWSILSKKAQQIQDYRVNISNHEKHQEDRLIIVESFRNATRFMQLPDSAGRTKDTFINTVIMTSGNIKFII